MRIAHITDVHVHERPRLGELFNKRALGMANLYVAGRRSHFTRTVQEALVAAVVAQDPDILCCTGDLTAIATRREFEMARTLLGPLFERQPSVLIPGNHDTYVGEAVRGRWIEERFGDWTGSGPWPRLHLLGEDIAFVAVDTCRASVLSSGRVDSAQLERLDVLLADPRLRERFVFLMLHYPLRGRDGAPYGPNTRNISNAADLETVIARHNSVDAIVHGHEHHGFRTVFPTLQREVPILNPGASGYAWLPDQHRTAHFCVYTVHGGTLTDVERFAYDGAAFVPEAGGAWASGG